MAQKHLTGTITLRRTTWKYEYFDLKLKATKAVRKAFDRNPKRVMAAFLRRKGFKVNSIRVLRGKKNTKDAGTDIDIKGARHVRTTSGYSGWV